MFSLDDPVIGDKAVNYEVCKKNPWVLLGTNKKGGHVGYIDSLFGDPWYLGPTYDFLDSFRNDK